MNDVKIVGKIDIDAINEKTRPKKKSRNELEKERKERLEKLKQKIESEGGVYLNKRERRERRIMKLREKTKLEVVKKIEDSFDDGDNEDKGDNSVVTERKNVNDGILSKIKKFFSCRCKIF